MTIWWRYSNRHVKNDYSATWVLELSFCIRRRLRHHRHHRYNHLLIFFVRVCVCVSFFRCCSTITFVSLFAFTFVNGNFYKQLNKHLKEAKQTGVATLVIIAIFCWWIYLRKSSRNCRKKIAFTCAFGARLSFLSVIVYWIRSSGRSLLKKKQTNKTMKLMQTYIHWHFSNQFKWSVKLLGELLLST